QASVVLRSPLALPGSAVRLVVEKQLESFVAQRLRRGRAQRAERLEGPVSGLVDDEERVFVALDERYVSVCSSSHSAFACSRLASVCVRSSCARYSPAAPNTSTSRSAR